LAYADFCCKLGNIQTAVYKQLDIQKSDTLNTEIVFTPKKLFRKELTPTYKAKRPPRKPEISELLKLVYNRIGATVIPLMEADDIVITRAYEKENVVIACIDKDVTDHSPVLTFNYNTWEWGRAYCQEEIEDNYWIQALMGDSGDGIKGAKGIGKETAPKIVLDVFEPFTYEKYVSYFDSEEDAILSMRLVRMDQYRNGELKLWQNH
jgi:5'-3' exonuclease